MVFPNHGSDIIFSTNGYPLVAAPKQNVSLPWFFQTTEATSFFALMDIRWLLPQSRMWTSVVFPNQADKVKGVATLGDRGPYVKCLNNLYG